MKIIILLLILFSSPAFSTVETIAPIITSEYYCPTGVICSVNETIESYRLQNCPNPLYGCASRLDSVGPSPEFRLYFSFQGTYAPDLPWTQSYAHPAILTLATCPVATPVWAYNHMTQQCERESTCLVNAAGPSGYWQISAIDAFPPAFICSAGCEFRTTYTDYVTQTALNGSTLEYYMYADSVGNGGPCSTDPANPTPTDTPVAAVPPDKCPAFFMLVEYPWGYECTSTSGNENISGAAPSADTAVTGTTDNPASTQTPTASTTTTTTTTTTNIDGSTTTTGTSTTVSPPLVPDDLAKTGEAATAALSITTVLDQIYSAFTAPVDAVPSTVETETTLTNETRAVNAITPLAVGSTGVCPADQTISIAGHSLTTSYQTYCSFAEGIRPILLLFAWLAAAGILIGGFKQT